MIDIKKLRENPELFKKAAIDKGYKLDFDKFLAMDAELLQLRQLLQDLATEKNAAGKAIGKMKDATERQGAIDRVAQLKDDEKKYNDGIAELEPQFNEMMLRIPQPASPDSPIGKDESENVVTRNWGDLPKFDFEPKDHIALGTALGIIDQERGVKLSGSRFYVLKGDGCLLQRAIMALAHDMMVKKGFEPLSVPVITREETFMGTGWFPEGKPQVYQIPEDDLFMIGTAEVPATSLYMNEILDGEELPKKFVAQSLCFRREAGAAGKDTAGLYRVHQFEKVEQVIICKNDSAESEQWHQQIVKNSEELMQALELPYRVLEICTGDMGMAKYRMYDIETWMPSRDAYCETHSASNLQDFQARRLNLRYRDENKKVHFCHTLNNTVVASPRVLIPVLEQYQNADGSIRIPKALQPYMFGREVIK
ncbi:MAG: serine--tRNA ligase [Phycisphaerae bacterium]|nr:serine--tRNA ligase [Phycisphaerae bacterium]